MRTIYLDYNATTPIDPEVAEAMKPFIDSYFGNPSSTHEFGIQTKIAVENARKQVAESLNCNVDELIFTSGGTESNNYAIKGVALANKSKGNHIITSIVEHPAVIEVCKYLSKNAFDITYLDVDEFGLIDINELKNAIRKETILITIMHANNEVGTIQPIEEISKIAKEKGIIFHTDAAQSVGKIKTDVNELGVDLLSVAGHKLYAPKGIGALYIKRGVKLEKLIHGADHEQNLRAGTENILEIVGLGKACEVAKRNLQKNYDEMKIYRDMLFEGIKKKVENVKLNGHPEKRLPNTLNLSFENIEANILLEEMKGIAASAGAACHSENIEVSSVLAAMQIPIKYAMGTIRFSVGRSTNNEEIEKAIEIIGDAVARLSPTMSSSSEIENVDEEIKLTNYTHGLGCACKIRPQYLERVLKNLGIVKDPNVLVGKENSDDASVYKISDEIAIVQSVDFFTPIVDDPYDFGAIAAANSLSDIYAMGAKPLFALNIVGFPDNRLPEKVLSQILKGAEDKAHEAGIDILGGHTVEDTEPKFGLVVTGVIHPDKILTNSNAQETDVLVLTKALGTGILSTALKRNLLDKKKAEIFIKLMKELNNKASEIAKTLQINACTDVTGFGLLGHLSEMTKASKIDVELLYENIPVLEGVMELAVADIIPGGTKNNLEHVQNIVEFDKSISNATKYILADAQTSGGLLFSLPKSDAEKFVKQFKGKDIFEAKIIGKVKGTGEGRIFVR
ncbi:MAG: selenide, water dikinase SelD [Bacteroidota bacterium]|nr:selenide, water dikinase SelD [Bacteroidota bacterium]